MKQCAFCTFQPPIRNSHVVPAFIVRFLKANSPTGFLLNSWARSTQLDGFKGPYLCRNCDNVVFSQWENRFKQLVFDRLQAGNPGIWEDPDCVRLLLSIAFRYAIHFLETSPMQVNAANNQKFADLTRRALQNLNLVNSQIFLYPYAYQPIVLGCEFLPGVNQFLRTGFSAQSLPSEPPLPDGFLLMMPSMIILFTDSALRSPDCAPLLPTPLVPSQPLAPTSMNTAMPLFLETILNRGVGQTQAHQKDIGFWGRIHYGLDKRLNPNKAVYKAQAADQQLRSWQQINCSKQS